MLANQQPQSKLVHRLARFVTKQAIALRLRRKPQEIYRIQCWRYVIHVVAKGLSTFVSYADLPPIVGVEIPTAADINCWRKRWQRNQYKAPEFWAEFFAAQFKKASNLENLYAWGQLVAIIQFGLSRTAIGQLRCVFAQERESCLLSF